MKPGAASRLAAAKALGRVLRMGAYSNIVVGVEADRIAEADHRHTQRLVLGTLRALSRCDAAITAVSKRPIAELDQPLVDVLRIAAFEIEEGGPAYAVVDSAVESARDLAGPGAGRYANAVLRRLQPVDGTDRALRHGAPPWLLEAVDEAMGDEADAFWEASNRSARSAVWSDEAVPGLEALPRVPGAGYLVFGAKVPSHAVVLDPASAAVVQAMDVAPGQRVADLTAAPGGKTAIIARRLGEGFLLAGDVHERRLASTRKRLGETAHWMVADARRPPLAERSFDRVLLDAPCTGLGTLRRRPEIRWRLQPGSARRMAEVQRPMLEAAVGLVRRGGRLVYSACTIFPDETSSVVAGLGAVPPDGLPGERWGDGWLLSPHRTNTDGMFIAVIEV